MCCLRYEHEFYVQSRKRFPKEGRIVATSLGEAKVISVDIFRERITLRGVEGDVRTIGLADFKRETGQPDSGEPATAVVEEEDFGAEGISPDEISPELQYTAEHPVFVPPNEGGGRREAAGGRRDAGGDAPTSRPTASDAVPGTDGREGGSAGKRRRGRRGGRRGRGGEEPGTSGGQ